MSGAKKICVEPVKDVQKIEKSTLGKKDHSSFSQEPLSPPNLCPDTSVVQNSSSSVNISEAFDKDDNEVLKILNEFLR